LFAITAGRRKASADTRAQVSKPARTNAEDLRERGVFFHLAKFQTVKQYFFVFVTDKYVNPINSSKTYKVKPAVISEFVFTAHIDNFIGKGKDEGALFK